MPGRTVSARFITDLQVLGQPSGVGVDRAGRPPQISPDPQPPDRSIMATQDRPLLLEYDGAQQRSSATRETVLDKIVRSV
jgi:hypothetical protein